MGKTDWTVELSPEAKEFLDKLTPEEREEFNGVIANLTWAATRVHAGVSMDEALRDIGFVPAEEEPPTRDN